MSLKLISSLLLLVVKRTLCKLSVFLSETFVMEFRQEATSGFTFANDDYQKALKILWERYGNPSDWISSHM